MSSVRLPKNNRPLPEHLSGSPSGDDLRHVGFYGATRPEEALRLYLAGHDELYGRVYIATIKRALASVWPNLSSRAILEVGCAGGIWTEFFLAQGARVTGVDVLEPILEANRRRNPRATFVLGDATTVSIPTRFDLVFGKDVIEHIQDDRRFLQNMSRHLKDGGLLLLTTQNSLSLNFLLQGTYHYLVRRNRDWCGWDPTHVRFYNFVSLRRKLRAAGFQPIKWFGSYYFPYRLFAEHFGRRWESEIFCAIERSPLYDKFPLGVLGWDIGVIAIKRTGRRPRIG